jgi:hypothetical protein
MTPAQKLKTAVDANRKLAKGGKAKRKATANISGTKVVIDGIVFGSKAEARHWRELVLRQLAG